MNWLLDRYIISSRTMVSLKNIRASFVVETYYLLFGCHTSVQIKGCLFNHFIGFVNIVRMTRY